MDNKHATHIDVNGRPVAFSDDSDAFHPTPCCGAAATTTDGPLFCKACYHDVEDWYSDIPRGPYEVLLVEGNAQEHLADTVDEFLKESTGMASRPAPGYPDDVVLTVNTDPESSRRGFLVIISQSSPLPIVSFSSFEGEDRMDIHAQILESCRSTGATRAVDAEGNEVDPNDLIDMVIDNHPRHRVLNGSRLNPLPSDNTSSVYKDLDGKLVRARKMNQPFILDDQEIGEAGDYIVRDEDGTKIRIIKADRFEIEHTVEVPGIEL